MHQNRMNIGDFYALNYFNVFNIFSRLGPIFAPNRHQRHQNFWRPLFRLFHDRYNLIGWDVVPFPNDATRKCYLEMGNFLFKIQTKMRFLEIL